MLCLHQVSHLPRSLDRESKEKNDTINVSGADFVAVLSKPESLGEKGMWVIFCCSRVYARMALSLASQDTLRFANIWRT